ncbi:DNA polymerase [Coemansia reversa NRRL 1564]|uniref:DNA polymerase n=1 Tax=Coemansia reversa (strain ATCC 12441 / NRRL 1564) TaxID=763665 RepID=A0A2G5B0R5_COERN|nr:DNA polymerase [Coemansia reversa NRRL 1564]|eukprot:PIA12612.1 DNA polymerase [Coemansia reversa NRRL 1564]
MEENTDRIQDLIESLSRKDTVELDEHNKNIMIKYLVELEEIKASQLHNERVNKTARLARNVITRQDPKRISYHDANSAKHVVGVPLTFDCSCEFPNVEPNPTYHVNGRVKGFRRETINGFIPTMSEMITEAFKYVPRLRRPIAYFIFQIFNNGHRYASTRVVDVESSRIEDSIDLLYNFFEDLIRKIEEQGEGYENIIAADNISFVHFHFAVKYYPEPQCIDNWGTDINSVEKCYLFDIFTANNKNENCILQCAKRIWGEDAKEDCIAEIIKRSNNKLCILQPRNHVKNVFNINSYSHLIVDPLSPVKKFNVIDPDIVYLIHWRGHVGVLENMKQQKRNQFRTSFRPLQKYPSCENVTVCFDIECYFDPYSKNEGTRHIPYLCCACFIYNVGKSADNRNSYESKVGNVIEFEGRDCVAQMIDWSAELANQFGHKSIELIAHNGGGYDFHYILSSIYDPSVVKDILIRNNNFISFKFKHMDINFSVKDSLNFLLCSLSSAAHAFLAKTDSSEVFLQKTDFPHHEVRSKEDLQRTFQKWISVDNIVDTNTEKEKMLITSKHFINYSKDEESRKLIEWAKEYCCNDVIVLSMVWTKFKETVADIFNCHIVDQTYTLAGLSFRLFEAHLPRDIYLVHPVKEDFINMRKALIGGRCISANGIYENIACLDVKSLYPAAMAFYDQPYGNYFKVKKRNPNELGIYYIKVEPKNVEKHGFFPLRNENNEVYYTGKIKPYKGWYTTVDIDIGIQEGHKIEYIPFNACDNCRADLSKINLNEFCSSNKTVEQRKDVIRCTVHEGAQTCAHGHVGYSWKNKGKIFKEYITDVLYKLKIQYEQAGDKEKRQVIKIIMNSLWGKFAQKWMDTKYKIVIEDNANLKEECYKIWDTDHMLVKNYQKPKYSKKPVQNGVFTLSWARWHMKLLWDALASNRPGDRERSEIRMLYSDTDSIMVREDMINKNAKFVLDGKITNVIGTDVGQLEIEYNFDELICVGRKQYMGKYYKNGIPQYKLRFKGVPQQYIKPEMYTHLLNNPNHKVQVDFLKFKREWGAVHGYIESKTVTQT